MSQMSFSDFEYAGKRKQTRRERFLAEIKDECAGHGIDYRLALTTEDPARLLLSWLSFRAAISLSFSPS